MKISGVAKKMILIICISFVIVTTIGFVIGAMYFSAFEYLPFAIGVFLGCVLNVIKIIMLDRAVNKAVNLEKADAKNYLGLQYFARFLLTAAVLALAIFSNYVNIWGAFFGILTMQAAAVSMKYYVSNEERANKLESTDSLED